MRVPAVLLLLLVPALAGATGVSTLACDLPVPRDAGACLWRAPESQIAGSLLAPDADLHLTLTFDGADAGALARRVNDGTVAWAGTTLDDAYLPRGASAGDVLVLGGARLNWVGAFAAFDAATGAPRWARDIQPSVEGGRTSVTDVWLDAAGARGYAHHLTYGERGWVSNALRAFDLSDGSTIWERGDVSWVRHLLMDDTRGQILILGFEGKVRALDAATGATRWTAGLPPKMQDTWVWTFDPGHLAFDEGGDRVVAAFATFDAPRLLGWHNDVLVLSYDAATGAFAWSTKIDFGRTPEQLDGLAVVGERVVVGVQTKRTNVATSEYLLVGLDARDGILAAVAPLPGEPHEMKASPDGSMLVAAMRTTNYYAPTPWSGNTVLAAYDADLAATWMHFVEDGGFSRLAFTPDGETLLATQGESPRDWPYLEEYPEPLAREPQGYTVALRAR